MQLFTVMLVCNSVNNCNWYNIDNKVSRVVHFVCRFLWYNFIPLAVIIDFYLLGKGGYVFGSVGLSVCLSICLLTTLLKKL